MSDETNNMGCSDRELKILLEEIASEENFHDYQVEKIYDSAKGDGYVGMITAVKISGKDKTGRIKTMNLIVKSASKNDALRKLVVIDALYNREIYIYNTVFPAFKMLELANGLSPCTFAAKFYKGCLSYKSETVILENLREIDYHLYERRIPMNDDHVSLVMAEYGRLHALSFALRDQQLENFENVTGRMDDFFLENTMENNFLNNFVYRCTDAQKVLDRESDKEALTVYKTFLDTILSFFKGLPETVDSHSVILHGDCWTNNMMFKYEYQDNTSKPTTMRFLDFQISRMGSPVLDLSYFFYTCSSTDIIENLDHYLHLYYDSFSSYLRKLRSDPEDLFPYSVLEQHWKLYARYGLIFSIFIIYIMLTEKEEVIDLGDMSESGKLTSAFDYEIGKIDQYYDRVKPIILHFVKNKFI